MAVNTDTVRNGTAKIKPDPAKLSKTNKPMYLTLSLYEVLEAEAKKLGLTVPKYLLRLAAEKHNYDLAEEERLLKLLDKRGGGLSEAERITRRNRVKELDKVIRILPPKIGKLMSQGKDASVLLKELQDAVTERATLVRSRD